MTRTNALVALGILAVVVGVLALLTRRFDWIDKLERHSHFRDLVSPYRLLDVRWLGGGRQRSLAWIGFLLIALGLFILLRVAVPD